MAPGGLAITSMLQEEKEKGAKMTPLRDISDFIKQPSSMSTKTLPFYLAGQKLVIWLILVAKEAGKYSLFLHLSVCQAKIPHSITQKKGENGCSGKQLAIS